MGDFNAAPASSTVQRVLCSFTSAYRMMHGEEPAFTFPTPLVAAECHAPETIDYIFVDPRRFAVQTAHLAFNSPALNDPILYPSDHYGLAAVLELL
jgi:endonuclease/exonuclease/phosphatase family metal-dependent hydrolase